MDIQPVGHRLLVRPAPQETTTKTGFILEGQEKERPERGTIVELGRAFITNVDRHESVQAACTVRDGGPMRVSENTYVEFAIGDVVLFEKYATRPVKDEKGEELLILNASDVLAIIS